MTKSQNVGTVLIVVMYVCCCCSNYRRPSGIDREFLIQLFVEPDEHMPTVNTQRLLNEMFQEQSISFLKVCLNTQRSVYL